MIIPRNYFLILKQLTTTDFLAFPRIRLFQNRMESKRQKLSTSSLITPTSVTIQVLSNGASHIAVPSVIIRTPIQSYIFNCPEGVSRFISINRIRFNQITDLFVTRDVWGNIGGTTGLILGKSDNNMPEFRIHGPSTINRFIETLRKSIDDSFETNYPAKIKNCDNKCNHYEDSAILVHYLQISNQLEPRYVQKSESSSIRMPITNVAFLIELKKCPPHIDPLKLIRLKVPKTSVIAKLKAGETVTLDDGRIIKPEDVIDFRKTEYDFPFLLVVDIRSEENLESIVSNPQLLDYYDENRAKQMNHVIHFAPSPIFAMDKYREWLQRFGPKCTHLLLNGEGKAMPQTDKIFNDQNMLRVLFPEAFPELYPRCQAYQGQQFTEDSKELDLRSESAEIGPIIAPGSNRRFSMRGDLDRMDQIKLDFIDGENALKERMKDSPDELSKEIEKFNKIKSESKNIHPDKQYPILAFLGTGSAAPSLYRNVSANLLQTCDKSNILIDCGENTYGQLRTLYGPEECTKLLVNLHAIFLTHDHLDHFLGIFTVIQKRIQAFRELEIPYRKLLIVGNYGIQKMCTVFNANFFDLRDYIYYMDWVGILQRKSNAEIVMQRQGYVDLEQDISKGFPYNEWNLHSIRAVQVIHKKWSCGFVFTLAKDRIKLVFSGDTMPSANLEKHGKDADILVHECTFEDGMEDDALRKRHSTMRQAFDSANRMNAKNTIFTHFSIRYSHVSPLPDYLLEADNFSCAKDNIVISFGQLFLHPKLLPLYRHLYKEELFEMEMKNMNYSLRKKLEAEDEERREDERTSRKMQNR